MTPPSFNSDRWVAVARRDMTKTKLEYTESRLRKYMRRNGLIRKGWTYRITSAKTYSGICKYYPKRIEITRDYINSEKTNKKSIKNTILHEIAHALVGTGQGHNRIWKEKCISIGGIGEQYCKSFNTDENYKYIIKCGKGCIFKKHRLSKLWKEGKHRCKLHKRTLQP